METGKDIVILDLPKINIHVGLRAGQSACRTCRAEQNVDKHNLTRLKNLKTCALHRRGGL